MVSDPNNPNSVAYNSRNKRMQMFISALQGAGISNAFILDVGGTYKYWEKYAEMLPARLIRRIDIVNLPEQVKDLHGQEKDMNGVKLRFLGLNLITDDKSCLEQQYDVVHSISVIEHVGGREEQRQMCEQIQALGRYHWVQTPAKEFPLEAHFYLPFFAYWPLALRAFMNWRFRLGVMPRHRNWQEAKEFCRSTLLIIKRQMHPFFPNFNIWGLSASTHSSNATSPIIFS